MSVALVRSHTAVAWELRGAWAKGWRVALVIDGDVTHVEGYVTSVAPSGAYAIVGDLHVPLEAVLTVRRPSRLGDTTYREDGPWRGPIPLRARRDPRQLEIPGL